MSTRQKLINAASKHQVFIQRYAGSTYRQMLGFIKKVERETFNILNKPEITTFSKKRFETVVKDLTAMQKSLYNDMGRKVKKSLSSLAKYEADFTQRLLEQSTTIGKKDTSFIFASPTLAQLQAAAFTSIVDRRPGYNGTGITVGDALQDFGIKKTGDVLQTVRVGFALGKPTPEIAKDIQQVMGTIIPRQAQALARTVTNHVAATSRDVFFKENRDVITGYQVVATLDDRTTLTCGALDGKVFDVEDFDQPPYHWNCRTTFIAIVAPEFDLGSELQAQRPSKGEDGPELVSTQTTYNSWLKGQSAEFQDEVLGPERGKLFRGGMSVDKFVDNNYQPINLDQLKSKDEEHIFTR